MSTCDSRRFRPPLDRFITLRAELPLSQLDFSSVERGLYGGPQPDRRAPILAFHPPKGGLASPPEEIASGSFQPEVFKKSKENSKVIKNGSVRGVRAEGFRNDYYTNVLDCRDEETIGAVLSNVPYVYCSRDGGATALASGNRKAGGAFTSLKFDRFGCKLATGLEQGGLELFDLEGGGSEVLPLHLARVGCLDWNPLVSGLLASGSKDRLIKLKDFRSSEAQVGGFSGHVGEICGLAWNPSGTLLASGGNDNLVSVWDPRGTCGQPLLFSSHRAAVRALCWAPFRDNLLASGGGSGDMRLLVHNTDRASLAREIETDSQICAVGWDNDSRALLTAHGFSRNQICVWDFEEQKFVLELLGHKSRVLGLVAAGGKGLFVSASPDETIRFWDLKTLLRKNDHHSGPLRPVEIR